MPFGFKRKKKLDTAALEVEVIAGLKEIYDPEIPVNIYDLGLIYGVDVSETGDIHILLTLTTPGCPVAETFPGTIEAAITKIELVNSVTVELVWEPPWTQERMTEAAKLQLGLL